jgi:hypothetical protein
MTHGIVDHIFGAKPTVEIRDREALFSLPLRLGFLDLGKIVVDKLRLNFPRFGKSYFNKTGGVKTCIGNNASLAFAFAGGNTDKLKTIRSNIGGSGRIKDELGLTGGLAANNAFFTLYIGKLNLVITVLGISVDIDKRARKGKDTGVLFSVPLVANDLAILPLGIFGLAVVVDYIYSDALIFIIIIFFFKVACNYKFGKRNRITNTAKADKGKRTDFGKANEIGAGRRFALGIIVGVEISVKVRIRYIAAKNALLVKRFGGGAGRRLANTERPNNTAAVNHKVGRAVNYKVLVGLFDLSMISVSRKKHN